MSTIGLEYKELEDLEEEDLLGLVAAKTVLLERRRNSAEKLHAEE